MHTIKLKLTCLWQHYRHIANSIKNCHKTKYGEPSNKLLVGFNLPEVCLTIFKPVHISFTQECFIGNLCKYFILHIDIQGKEHK